MATETRTRVHWYKERRPAGLRQKLPRGRAANPIRHGPKLGLSGLRPEVDLHSPDDLGHPGSRLDNAIMTPPSTSRRQRNPLLLFLFVGLFLLRFDTRSLLGLLFQEPPRSN